MKNTEKVMQSVATRITQRILGKLYNNEDQFISGMAAGLQSAGYPELSDALGEWESATPEELSKLINRWAGERVFNSNLTLENPVRQRKGWKIQTGSGNGWSDIKFSSGSDFYRTQYFKTKPAAQSELNALARIHGDPESYRIVPAATEEDFDLYNPVHRKNPVRQRIAVSLSRSQASRRNPFNDRNLDA